jgi:hypothetical protein
MPRRHRFAVLVAWFALTSVATAVVIPRRFPFREPTGLVSTYNAAAQNLDQLLNFYNQRFQMNLTDEEQADLIAFLNSL